MQDDARGTRRKRILLILFLLFFLLFIISAVLTLSTWMTARNEKKQFDDLTALTRTSAVIETNIEHEISETQQKESADNTERFSALYEQNNDFIGWLFIDDNAINYPVMYTPEEPEYYLHRNFNKEESSSGVPFLGAGCTVESDNIIIYGHNMKNGTMFSALTNYSDKSYYLEHRYISFDTLNASGTYEIIAVFQEKVHPQDETGVFCYYEYGGDLTEEEFDEYLSSIMSISLYDTGLTAEYGDKLLTLSTCAYHTSNGRFVVVAREII